MIMQLIKCRNFYELRKKVAVIAEIWENILEQSVPNFIKFR